MAKDFKFKSKKPGPSRAYKKEKKKLKTLVLNPPVFIRNLRECLVDRRKTANCETIETEK